MADDVAVGGVNPDTGIVIDGRAGDQEYFIAGMEAAHVSRSFSEDGTVHGGPEARRLLRRQRRWCAVIHGV